MTPPTEFPWQELLQKLERLERRVIELEAENARQAEEIARLKRNSSNSNKPSSSDPPWTGGGGGGSGEAPNAGGSSSKKPGKPGAKPGHAKYQRTPFPPERVDKSAPTCELPEAEVKRRGLRPLEGADAFAVFQQVESLRAIVVEYRVRRYFDPKAGKMVLAPHPKGISSLLGTEAAAAVSWMKYALHASYAGLAALFKDVLGAPVCAGLLAKAVDKTRLALDASYKEIGEAIVRARLMHADETPHTDWGFSMWCWARCTAQLAHFTFENQRDADAARPLLEKFAGILVSDRYAVYAKLAREIGTYRQQYCLAHLAREIKGLAALPTRPVKAWAEKLEDAMGAFWVGVKAKSQEAMRQAKETLLGLAKAPPDHRESKTLAKSLTERETNWFLCVEDLAVPPTNNAAERILRPVVMHRKVTQGTRSHNGIEAAERMWTHLCTCALQGRSAFRFIADSLAAHLHGNPAPSLVYPGV